MTRIKSVIVLAFSAAIAAAVAVGFSLSSGAAASARPRADAAAVSQTIDAKTDPAVAGKALSDFCQVIANCQFVGTVLTVKYDEPRVLGDALYNCGQSDAEDEVAISDERSESTSVDESLSTTVKLGFLGLAKAAVEAEVNSKQLDEVATTLKQTNTVSVAPGTVGYTETRVPTAYLTGDAHITNGVNLVAVTNLELTYPGYGSKAINKVDWTDVHKNMTATDRQVHCAGLPPLYSGGATAVSQPPQSRAVVVCTGNHGRCTSRRLITDTPLSISAGTNLTLARGDLIYATGSAGQNAIVLRARHPVQPGTYTLLLSGPHQNTMLQLTIR